MLKVIFLTEGGKERGYGHLARCRALCDEFARAGHAARLIVRGDETVSAMLEAGTYVLSDWLGAAPEPCDVLVLDSYSYTPEDCARLSRSAGLLVFFDDINRIPLPPGIVINGALTAATLDYAAVPGAKLLLGPRYQLLRPEFLEAGPRPAAGGPRSVLITFGGNDMRGMTPFVLDCLNASFSQLDKTVVIGNSYAPAFDPGRYAGANTTFVRAPAGRDWAGLMRRSDFAVCAGGQTLFELAASGTPAVVIGIADNQRELITGWSKAGFISFAGWYDAPDLKDGFLGAVKGMLVPGRLEQMRQKASGIVNPAAAQDLVAEISATFRQAGGRAHG